MKIPFDNMARYFPFSRYLMISLLVIIIIIIGVFSAFSYNEGKENLISKNQALQEETESSIVQSAVLVDKGMQLFDATFDAKMERAFDDFIAEYDRSHGNPGEIDLESLKQKLEEEYEGSFDLYVIDSEGVVAYTTYEHDRGLDFKQWPEVYQSITGLREGDAFSADRIVHGFNPTGELRKFAYMPTSDHRYLLEMSLTSDSFKTQRSEFSYRQISKDLVRLDPNLRSIVFYDSMGRKTTSSNDLESGENEEEDQEVNEQVKALYEDKITREFYDEQNETLVRYIYIDLSGGEYVSSPQMSLVTQLTYDLSLQNAEIRSLLVSQIIITMLAVLMGMLFAYGSSRYISRPINEIVEDTTIIAKGDLDHAIRPTKGLEFQKLEQSINIMVARLKDTIQKLKESEGRIKEYTGQLEEMVAERTAELQKSTNEMSLYLTILSHDVRVSNTITGSYLELLKKSLSGKNRRLTEQALKETAKSIGVISNVDVIRRIYAEDSTTVPVALDDVIDQSIHRHPDLNIQTTPGGAHVFADDLLIEVFNTIIEMITRHTGQDVVIEITSRKKDQFCEVSIVENKPGIPESMKKYPFSLFGTGMVHLSGEALSPYIAWLLVERYGGSIWSEELVRGQPNEGMAVRFTLRTVYYELDDGENPNTG